MEHTSSPATTYQETSGRYRSTADARERFEELAVREVSARAFMALAARGDYDRRAHGDPGGSRPLTVTEHLELLAAGELLSRYYRHPAHAHRALQAGATWAQVSGGLAAQFPGNPGAKVLQGIPFAGPAPGHDISTAAVVTGFRIKL